MSSFMFTLQDVEFIPEFTMIDEKAINNSTSRGHIESFNLKLVE